LVEWKASIARDGKVVVQCDIHDRLFHMFSKFTLASRVDRKRMAYLLSISPSHAWFDLAQYLTHVQDAIYHYAIRRTLDFEIPEECIGTE